MDEDEDRYQVWAADETALGEIGRVLFTQPTRIPVRLPSALASVALASWERYEDDRTLPAETPDQRKTRHQAGTLALIGLAVQEGGVADGDEVIVELCAWEIGSAMDAADDAGLLRGLNPPRP